MITFQFFTYASIYIDQMYKKSRGHLVTNSNKIWYANSFSSRALQNILRKK